MKSKKELKNDYKQMKFPMGVFQVINLVNNKILIGSSNDLNAIWNRIRTQLRFGNFMIDDLQNDWKKYGEGNFKYEILSELKQDDPDKTDYSKDIKALEELYLEELQPYDERGYNRRKK
ncbi:MAG: GIY-YIG nuclease family protein [Bacteroidales bacterium]|nr:GIY-YIG nuclease family protein [Bacteroidales bacterium]